MFSCEFCEISKNTFSYITPPVAASGKLTKLKQLFITREKGLDIYLSIYERKPEITIQDAINWHWAVKKQTKNN